MSSSEVQRSSSPSPATGPPGPAGTAEQPCGYVRETRLRRYLDPVTLILAVLAIAFAVFQFLDSRHLKRATEGIQTQNEKVLHAAQDAAENASTKYVDEFPKNIPFIRDLVQGTCEHLDILADVPGYGMYSAPGDFQDYYTALLRARRTTVGKNAQDGKCAGKSRRTIGADDHPQVRLLLFLPTDRDCSLRKQFKEEAFESGLRTDEGERSKFLAFADQHQDMLRGTDARAYMGKVASGNEYQSFISYLLRLHRKVEDDLHDAGIEIRYARKPLVYMRIWKQDSAYAIFSFDHWPAGSTETELAFSSRAQELVTNFGNIIDDHWGQDTIGYNEYRNKNPTNPEGCPKD